MLHRIRFLSVAAAIGAFVVSAAEKTARPKKTVLGPQRWEETIRKFGAGGNAGPMEIRPGFVPGGGMPGGLRRGAAFANENQLRLLRLEWPKS